MQSDHPLAIQHEAFSWHYYGSYLSLQLPGVPGEDAFFQHDRPVSSLLAFLETWQQIKTLNFCYFKNHKM